MFRQFCTLLSIFFLMLGAQPAAATNGELPASTPAMRMARHCQPQHLIIAHGDKLVLAGLMAARPLGADRSVPAAPAALPCFVASVHLPEAQSGIGNIPVNTELTEDDTTPTHDTPTDSARHSMDLMDAFEPDLVVAAGVAVGETASNFSVSRSSPALALLALAIVSMAAIARRPSSGPITDSGEL